MDKDEQYSEKEFVNDERNQEYAD